MQKEFWLECWQNNKIGFHQEFPHKFLVKHLDKLGDIANKTIFVPLCGKSIDMLLLLQHGAKIIACELSQKACEDFFSENRLTYTIEKSANFDIYHGNNIDVYCGDFFKLDKSIFANADIVYDRAALIALPSALRDKYVTQMLDYLPNKVNYLLITLDYVADGEIGPPFPVPLSIIEAGYGDKFIINKLDTAVEDIGPNSRLFALGVTQWQENIYLLEHKS